MSQCASVLAILGAKVLEFSKFPYTNVVYHKMRNCKKNFVTQFGSCSGCKCFNP